MLLGEAQQLREDARSHFKHHKCLTLSSAGLCQPPGQPAGREQLDGIALQLPLQGLGLNKVPQLTAEGFPHASPSPGTSSPMPRLPVRSSCYPWATSGADKG